MNKKRLLAIIMTVMLIVGVLPLSTFAEEDAQEATTATESVKEEAAETSDPSEDVKEEAPKAVIPAEDTKKDVPAAGGTVEKTKEETSKDSVTDKGTEKDSSKKADKSSAESEKKETEPAADSKAGNENSPAFRQSRTANGVTVSVAANAGVFPEGATLSVTSASSRATAAAIAPKRESGANIAASYTFDIKVLDKEGKELQPEEGRTVQVSFRAAEVADPNLDVNIYHISGGTADELAVQETGSTATARTNGFSYYTVEFTYGNLQYVLDGGGSVPLSDILSAVGLSGVPTDVQVSDSSLFSASNATGAWVITSHKAFSTTEWIRVTIAGKVYGITVTDAQEETIIGGVKYSYDTDKQTADVTGYTNDLPADVTIPATITVNGVTYAVTSVTERAFYNLSQIKSLTFEGGSKELSVSKSAFESCENLESLNFKGNVRFISNNAFQNCEKLTRVIFGGTIGGIASYAFSGCKSLRSLTLNSNGDVVTIGDYAFSGCSSLTIVWLKGVFKGIGMGAFQNCANLSSVNIEGSLQFIDENAFSECPALEVIDITVSEQQWRTIELGDKWATNSDLKVLCRYDVVVVPSNAGLAEGQTTIIYGADGKPDSSKPITATVHAFPMDPGYRFIKWTSNSDVNFANPTSLETSLTTYVESAQAQANFENYNVTVKGGTTEDSPAFKGETVAIKADEPASGMFFKCWQSEDIEDDAFDDVTAYETSFTMPEKSVTVSAVYKKILIGPAGGSTDDSIPDQVYTGSGIEPKLKVELEGVDAALIEGTDYDVEYNDNINVGDATAIVTLKNGWVGSASIKFKIAHADIKTAEVTAAGQTYDGTEKNPVPTVTWNGKTLTEGTDYDVTAYAGNKDAGDATVTVKGKGNFTGTANGTFTIAPAKATITVADASKVEGGADPAFTGKVEGLIAEGDLGEVTYSRTGNDEAPGTYKGVLTAAYTDNPNYDVTVAKGDFTITEKPVYKAASGSGGTYTKGSEKTLTFTYKRSADDETTFGHFKGITVDGKAVPEKDSSGKANWKAKSGSVIIELQSSYLETLSVGEHKLAVQFDDGADATSTFTVKVKPATPTKAATTSGKATTTAPKTGDESNMLLWFLLICVSLFVMSRIISLRNRRFYDR